MTALDQQRVVDFLSSPQAYGPAPAEVQRIDTHISRVFLTGRRAYKLKRAVTYPYLDYSTLDKRRAACERELRLNRRTAPRLYRATLAVTQEADGRLALGGAGEAIEWLVEMNRFDESQVLESVARDGHLTCDLARTLARRVAGFHEAAMPRRDRGGAAAMREVVNGNRDEMRLDRTGTFAERSVAGLHRAATAAIEAHAILLDARRWHGLVRQCHGDLHLRNIFLDGGVPTLFDAIEFNDDLACTDVIYDFAFLLMDLLDRRLLPQANAALNGYLEIRPDHRGLTLLPLFLSTRAAIRAKVALATATSVEAPGGRAALMEQAGEYLRLACRLIAPPGPSLVAIGGLSGSGKSTLARRLAPEVGPAPGAVVVRSDVIRKVMFGVSEETRLPRDAYAASVTARVYARALHAAEAAVRSGHAAIVDEVFADASHRDAVERLARQAGVPFAGLWLEVPFDVAAARLSGRQGDASDADVAVLRSQSRRSLGEVRWARLDGRRVTRDDSAALDEVLRRGKIRDHADFSGACSRPATAGTT